MLSRGGPDSAARMSQSKLESVQTNIAIEKRLAEQDKRLAEQEKRLAEQERRLAEQEKRLAEQERYQHEMELLLLQAQTAGLHTLKQVFKTPLPHLHPRLIPHQSFSKTKPSTPRTFSDILPWSEFTPGAYGLEESLDDVVVKYKIPSTTMEDATGLSSAADESEVRGVIVNLLYSINEAAKALGIQAECIGGGSGRTTSFMDLVLRMSGQLSDPKKLSSLVLGAGEVKGQWQLDLKPGETLEAVLKDPERVDAVLLALQQVYGDAVLDEAPMLIISSYHVTVFLKRGENVHDKRLWASQPVWWDQQQPTACSCWLWALHEATHMQHLKCKLPRMVVPQTYKGYDNPVTSKQVQNSSRKKLRRRAQPAIRLMASSTSHKGYEPVALATAPASSLQSPPDLDTRLAQPLAANPKLADELELSYASVGLTDKLVGSGQYGVTMLRRVNNERYAVKLYDNRQPEAIHAYFNEKACLQALSSCSLAVKLKMAGCLQDSLYPCIVTMYAGEPVHYLSAAQYSLAKEALKTFHQAGAAHGDIRLPNLLFDNGSCHVADLASCTLSASSEDKSSDRKQLSMLPH